MKEMTILLIIILTIIISFDYIKKIKLHTKAINQCLLMIENIEILLSYNNLSIKEIFNVLSTNKIYHLLTFLNHINDNMQVNESMYILNDDNITHIKNNKYLNNDDKETLINFFSLLGKSDLNGQIINCKTYKDIFKKKLKENETRELKDCKSSGMLILGIGFLIVIIVI